MPKTLDNKAIFDLVISYFASLNRREAAESFFTPKNFESAFVDMLSLVCLLIPKPSHQTHIHITGRNRYFFYPQSVIDGAIDSIEYEPVEILLSKANIESFKGNPLDDIDGLGTFKSYTNTKYLVRSDASVQVQVSKIDSDDPLFIEFRRTLRVNDLLVFLRLRESQLMYIVGIPVSFYSRHYSYTKESLSFFKKPQRTIKEVVEELAETHDENEYVSDNADIEDYIYQAQINEDSTDSDEINDVYEPSAFDSSSVGSTQTNRVKTKPSLAKSVIKKNGYRCFFASEDNPHKTFEKGNGKPYMEAHHLIPLSKQMQFENVLDTKANIIPLCPNCHRKVHEGKQSEVFAMLRYMYEKQELKLNQSGLSITLNQLEDFYRK